jgi:hypothetical protein
MNAGEVAALALGEQAPADLLVDILLPDERGAVGRESRDGLLQRVPVAARRIEALIDARLRPGADHQAFERAAVELPGAVAVEHLAGPVHYQLRASVATMEALDDLIQRLQALRAETNTKIITRTLRAA